MILLPTPRKVEQIPGTLELRGRQTILHKGGANHAVIALRELLSDDATRRPYAWSDAARTPIATVSIAPATNHPQGYTLSITPAGITITADDPAGAFYAVQTLKQLLRQYPGALPCCTITDHPDFPVRGYMQDISRDKVPTMETLFQLVDHLAELKYNQLQLYTEHTFAYAGHEEVWQHTSPITPDEIGALKQYCADRFIDLVPNQNTFGHMERWLRHPRYQPLAEKPDGFTFPWGAKHEGGFTLNPLDPRSLDLVKDLLNQLLPHFDSHYVNIGCDETFDLGLGKSKDECDRRGKEHVYLDFLNRIHAIVASHGRTMQFWGDIILHKPDLIPLLPRDAVALNWGYNGDHPFATETKAFADADVPFYVCPGTSSWLSITGKTDNAIANLKNAAACGFANNAQGYLVTDWGDLGHLQYLPVSYLGIAAGAAYAWCLATNEHLDLPSALSLHTFHDPTNTMGPFAHDLGNVYQAVKTPLGMSTRLFWTLLGDDTRKHLYEVITKEEFDDAEHRLTTLLPRLAQADIHRPDAQLIKEEFTNAIRMLRHATRRGRHKLAQEPLPPSALRADLDEIICAHRTLWLSRNRPGGLSDSTRRLERIRDEYPRS